MHYIPMAILETGRRGQTIDTNLNSFIAGEEAYMASGRKQKDLNQVINNRDESARQRMDAVYIYTHRPRIMAQQRFRCREARSW